MAKKALGKGLDAIFGDGLEETIKTIEKVEKGNIGKDQIIEIELSKITVNPYQPRKQFDEEKLEELAKSIKSNGLLSPIVVKKTRGNKYYIIAGERRYRAHKLANLKKIKAVVIDVTDKKMAELAIIENIQRENLNPIEEAVAIDNLMKTHKMTQASAAKVLHKSRPYVANLLRLLKLDKKIINAVIKGKVTYGQVKPLISLDKKTSVLFFDQIIKEELTSREVENKVRAFKLREAKANKPKAKLAIDAHIEYVKDLIRNKIHTPVQIEKKRIIIKYKDNDHLNRILKRMEVLED